MRIGHRIVARSAAIALAAGAAFAVAPSAQAAGSAPAAGPAQAAERDGKGGGDVSVLGGCSWLCGGVGNQSGDTMYFTLNLQKGAGEDTIECSVWNWQGGMIPDHEDAHCSDNHTLKSGSYGGWGSGKDVDAFTFKEPYLVKHLAGGLPKVVGEGEWTKISNLSHAVCGDGPSSPPLCVVNAW